MKQRGFVVPPIAYLIAGIAFLGALAGLYGWVHGNGVKVGEANIQAKWNKQIEKDRALEAARTQDVSDAIKEKEQQRLAALSTAADNDTKWKEKVREVRRLQAQLASVDAPKNGDPNAGVGVAGGGVTSPRISLLWRYVGLHDGAFTGIDGKPLFKAQSEYALAPERADTASPYGLSDAIDIHGENARGFSACLRAFDDAMSKIDAAEKAWGRAR